MKKKFLLLILLFAISSILLAIYSFSQIDLNLTLSTNATYQTFQQQLINLGYFHRPVSTAIYIIILALLAIGYWLLASLVKRKSLTTRQIWLLIGISIVILLPSYPAFSHDVFNYLFDARIVTTYWLSPWHYKALDFPQDEWIRFMRWTHRPSVYPPIWIGLSLVPSLLGFGKFIVTLGLFKILAASAYLGASALIFRVSKQLKNKQPLLTLTLFSFNPLVIIESLVNAHMEIVMIFFGLLSLHLMLKKNKILSWISFVTSVGVKFMTAYLALALVKNQKYFRYSIWLGAIGILAFILWYGFLPWYILWILPFALLLRKNSWEKDILIIASIAALFWNIPFVMLGDFDLPQLSTRLLYVVIPFGLGFGFLLLNRLIKTQD